MFEHRICSDACGFGATMVAGDKEALSMTSMPTSQSISMPKLWPESWAVQVAVDAERIESRMRIIRAKGTDNAQTKASEEAIMHLASRGHRDATTVIPEGASA